MISGALIVFAGWAMGQAGAEAIAIILLCFAIPVTIVAGILAYKLHQERMRKKPIMSKKV